MKANRSIPSATVVPVLIYPDVRAAVAWLDAAFGITDVAPEDWARPRRPPVAVATARRCGYAPSMRAVFVVYLTIIVTGLAYFTVIGLTHH